MEKHIVITGAGRGIGLELVKELSKNHRVLALSRNISELENLQNVQALSVDFADFSNFKKVSDFFENKSFPKVDILIHNAGKLINKPFEQLLPADFQEVFQVNVFAVAALTQCLLPYISVGGHVVNISSMGGVLGSSKFPGLAAYSASKGALITLTEVLAEEYKDRKIAFNALALGAVQTEMLADAFPGFQAPVSAAEMAGFIANFALTGSTFFNGKIIPVSSTTP